MTTTHESKSTYSILDDQFVTMQFITDFTTMTDKWIYQQIQKGKFPKQKKFGRKSVWLRSEVEAWAEGKVEEATEQVCA